MFLCNFDRVNRPTVPRVGEDGDHAEHNNDDAEAGSKVCEPQVRREHNPEICHANIGGNTSNENDEDEGKICTGSDLALLYMLSISVTRNSLKGPFERTPLV